MTMVVFDTDLKRGETQYVRAQLTPMSSLSRALEGKRAASRPAAKRPVTTNKSDLSKKH
ncbi:MAG: hypothetical protein ACLR8Y_05005 [Alistipes indistinctus]